MTMPLASYLDTLKSDAENANLAEDKFRREIVERTKEFERERAFAFRRFNLMQAVAEGMNSAESEEIAVAAAAAILRSRLGWSDDSEARSEVISRFAPVALAMFAQLKPEKMTSEPPEAPEALAAFESWYRETHPVAFWVLFENAMRETPLVDF